MRAHRQRNNKRILHGEQTRCEENLAGLSTNEDARSVCDIANLLDKIVM